MPVEPSSGAWKRPRFRRLPEIETIRRERWWFSDGAWINQGQSGSVVGVALTHWLADRGVEISGVSFDEQYATDLYNAAQRQAGQPESDSGGAQLSAGVQVLQSRGLVERCFRCADLRAATGALLERGPVLAGLSWYQSMFEPVRIDGVPVCRLADEEESPVGGHAVLLDGVSLDLELDGITGFVRFKNSWGREWGESGLCLISIDDLERLQAQSGEFLLLMPFADVLRPGITADAPPADDDSRVVRTSETKVAPTPPLVAREAMSYEPEAIGRDLWTTDDTVGYAVYADSIARGIQHPDTKPPLSIGIKAPWGAGKTSVMRMVQRRLEWPQTWRESTNPVREIRLTGSSAPSAGSVTNGALLRALRSRRPDPRELTATPEPESPNGTRADPAWRPTVWFNPWMYQTGEQIWAGFAQELINQLTQRMPRGQRERFWLELNLRRVDEQAVRRKIHTLVWERVVPWALAAATVLVLAGVLALTDTASHLIGWLAAGSPAALFAITIFKGAGVLRADVSGSLAAVVQPATAARKSAEGQLEGSFDEIVAAPDYRTRDGFFHLVQSDIQRVLSLVATEDRPLVIFVDDLDRCAPGTVVQVIEAINLFLAGEFQNAIFVIAVEPEMVAAHIETAYADLVAKVKASRGPGGHSEVLGWQFLEKFIQLPLTLPLMESTQTAEFVGALFGSIASGSAEASADSGGSESGALSGTRMAVQKAAATAAAEQMLAGASLGEAVKLAQTAAPGSAYGDAARRVVARKLSREDPEMRTMITYVAPFLTPNPREIKRFANVFRFLVMIASERGRQFDTPDELSVLAKLAVLSTRWPSVATDLPRRLDDDGRTVFELLEDPPSSQATGEARRTTAERQMLERALGGAGLSEASTQRLLDEELRAFMRCEPRIGEMARDWL